MKSFIKFVMSFGTGVCLGGFIAYNVAKKKFADRLEQEMESIDKVYKDRENQTKADLSKNKPALNEFVAADNVSEKEATETKKEYPPEVKNEYTNYAAYYAGNAAKEKEASENQPVEEQPEVKKPYVISADDYGATGYQCVGLIYYADGALTEEGSDKKLPVKKTIGSNVKHFDASGVMYIRDEEKETDYEVIKETRTYAQYHTGDD